MESSIYEKALALRYRVFFQPYNLPASITCDEHEEKSLHFVVADDGALIAYARLTETAESEYRISQVVVEPAFRGKGYGKALLKHVIQQAEARGAEVIWLNAQITAKKIYQDIGFIEVGGMFRTKLTKVAHIKMELRPSMGRIQRG